MSNVRVEAVGSCGLVVDVVLGANTRASHAVNAGEAVVLTVGGGQRLSISESAGEAAPTAGAEGDVPTGVDVQPEGDSATPVQETFGFPQAGEGEMFGQPE